MSVLRFLDDICKDVNKDNRSMCCVVEFNMQHIMPGDEIVIFFLNLDVFMNYMNKNLEYRIEITEAGRRLYKVSRYNASYLLNPICRGNINKVNIVSDQFILETVSTSMQPTDNDVRSKYPNIKTARNSNIERYYSLQVVRGVDIRRMSFEGINSRNFHELKNTLFSM